MNSKIEYINTPICEKDYRQIFHKKAEHSVRYLKNIGAFDKADKQGSFVIGINGPWGIGKSSYIRILVKKLINKGYIKTKDGESHDSLDIEQELLKNENLIYLEPWGINSKKSLTLYFLDELSRKISSTEKDESLANLLPKYMKLFDGTPYQPFFKLFSSLRRDKKLLWTSVIISSLWVTGIINEFFKLLLTSIYGSSLLITCAWILFLTSAFIFIGILIKKEYSPNIKKLIEDITDTDSIDSLKNKISTVLRNREDKFYVIIDDIDRLNREEVFEILKFVKQVLHFPNIIFILAFDKKQVEHQVAEFFNYERSAGKPSLYLHKIIDYYDNLEIEPEDKMSFIKDTLQEFEPSNIKIYTSEFKNLIAFYNEDLFEVLSIFDLNNSLESFENKEALGKYRDAFLLIMQDLTYRDLMQITISFYNRTMGEGWLMYDLKALLLILFIQHKYPNVGAFLAPVNPTFASWHLSDEEVEMYIDNKLKEKSKILAELPFLENSINLLIDCVAYEKSINEYKISRYQYEHDLYKVKPYHFIQNPQKLEVYINKILDLYRSLNPKIQDHSLLTKKEVRNFIDIYNQYNPNKSPFYSPPQYDIFDKAVNRIFRKEELTLALKSAILNLDSHKEGDFWHRLIAVDDNLINSILEKSNGSLFQLSNLALCVRSTSYWSKVDNDSEKRDEYNPKMTSFIEENLKNKSLKMSGKDDFYYFISLIEYTYHFDRRGRPVDTHKYLISEDLRAELIKKFQEENSVFKGDKYKEIVNAYLNVTHYFNGYVEIIKLFEEGLAKDKDNAFYKDMISYFKNKKS